jgi:D-ribose pyranose/furanose isomerase RbsD
LKNDYTFSQLNTNEFTNKKTNVTKEIDNEQLIIAQRIDSKNPQKSKKIISSKKVQQWAGIQIIKALLGIPTIPFE